MVFFKDACASNKELRSVGRSRQRLKVLKLSPGLIKLILALVVMPLKLDVMSSSDMPP
jgi:hypothetical protein